MPRGLNLRLRITKQLLRLHTCFSPMKEEIITQRIALLPLTPVLSTRKSAPLSPAANLAQAKLSRSPYLPLRRLICAEHEGVLTLRGEVSTFYHKQMAQAALTGIPGVEEINNQIRVIGAESPHTPR